MKTLRQKDTSGTKHRRDRQIVHFMPVMFWFCKHYRNTTKTQLQKFQAGTETRPKVSLETHPPSM
jgi:hypothetical protein